MSQWIKCSERMPEFYCSCLVCDDHEDMAIAMPNNLDAGERKGFIMSNGEIFVATHWMPLPEPPQE